MRIIKVKIEDLIPYENNPRINEDAVNPVAESIKQFGFKVPIVVDTNNVIIAGHTRLKASKLLGLKDVPCIVADDLSKEQIKAFRLADNKVGEIAVWDFALLAQELEGIEGGDVFGFDMDDLNIDEGKEGLTDPDAIPEEVDPTCKLGQIWKLGEHRIMCGDSTNKEDVEKLMDGEKADMVFTDPPYRMEAQGGSNQVVGKAARKLGERIKDLCEFEPDGFLERLPSIFNKKTMNAYIFCNKDLIPDYLNWAKEKSYSFNVLFWKKPTAIPLGGSHRPDVEYLLLLRKSAIWNNALKGITYSKSLQFGRESSTDHPTMKPIGLITNEVEISSNRGSIIADLFLGSGSTLIACEKTNRKCYGMEIDPHYCDVIIKRWEDYTGKKAELVKSCQQ